MALGKPVVAFNLHEVMDTARDAGIYVTSGRTDELGDRVIELLEDPEARRRMGEAGVRRFKEVLAWEHQQRHLLNAYRQLLGRSVPPRGAFVSWLPFHGRSQGFIDALRLEPIYVSYLRL